MSTSADEPIKIFVGTDRSQRIGLRVLEYSIAKHTSRSYVVHSLESVQLPEPNDKRNVQRTGFSFSRFAIPELCKHQGKAIYMDADMLVFKDIGELWDIPFGNHKMLVQAAVEAAPKNQSRNPFRKRVDRPKQTAVSLLDCSRLNWNAEQIVAGLDGDYNYKELMSDICILDDDEIGYSIPAQWNSLEHFDSSTCNLHYTDMQTQPWVCAKNPLGYLWVDTVREMLNGGHLQLADIEEEIRLGYARPSLLTEIRDQPQLTHSALPSQLSEAYDAEDQGLGFEMHKATYAAKRQRELQEKAYLEKNAQPWFKKLLAGAGQKKSKAPALTGDAGAQKKFSNEKPLKILFVANSPNLPTLQIAFTGPLEGLKNKGVVKTELLTEWMINENSRIRVSKSLSRRHFIDSIFREFQPDLLIFCRYTGLNAQYILDHAQLNNIPVVNCLDDDLLNVPMEIGLEKFNYYRDEQRQARMKYLLAKSDLVYSSTPELSKCIRDYGYDTEVFTASVFCPFTSVVNGEPVKRRFGYMGFGHEYDIKVALPGIVKVLRQLPDVEFELFGTIPKPPELNEFGSRVNMLEPEWDYGKFMQRLANRGWAVGICPLADLPFNEYKASTKWLEYSSVGAAVVASDHTVYRRVIEQHSGILVDGAENWFENIYELLNNEEYRARLVAGARAEALEHYGQAAFEKQLVAVLNKVNLCFSSNKAANTVS